jgi:hypothetical protein
MDQTLREQLLHSLTRSTPGEVFTRAADLTASTLNSNDRTVRVVATTEDPAMVYDWSRGGIVLEVLLMSGAEVEDQTPLLRDHNQYLVTAICGSFTEAKAVGDRLEGLITFGKDIDDVVEGIWRRIEQGHLRRVSVGYDYTRADYVTIPAGETQTVAGRSFTAPADRDLRVVFRWRLRELSLVVIPADARAQLKSQESTDRRGTETTAGQNSTTQSTSTQVAISHEETMNKFFAFLQRCGLAAGVSESSAQTAALTVARSAQLTSAQLDELDALCREAGQEFNRATCTAKAATPATTATRSADTTERNEQTPTHTGSTSGLASRASGLDLQRAANDAVTAERARISAIRQLGTEHEIAAEVVNRCIDGGMTLDQARGEFLTALRTSRQEGAPAIHVRNGLSGANGIRILQAALMARNGITPDSEVLEHQTAATLARRRDLNINWAINCGRSGTRRDELESAFDQVHQRGLRDATMFRMAQELIELETGQRAPYAQDEILERAFSTANFSAIFGSVIHLMMWSGYASTPASYQQFCQVVDVPDFKDNSEAMNGEVGRLKRQSKSAPGQAALLNMTDPVLAKIAADRYAGMLKITEQTFINDQFGALGQTPEKLGQSVQALVADLVFAQLLATGNLSDGRARFNTTDGNLISSGGTLDVAGMTAAEVLLRAKKVGDRRIQLGRTQVVTGITLGPKARVLQESQSLGLSNEEANPWRGTFDVVTDTAVDIGVSDPYTDPETAIAGRPNSYFLLTRDGNSIKVAFRQGTNRGPVTRASQMQQGEWGMCWDVYVDVGAAFLRRLGAVEVRT